MANKKDETEVAETNGDTSETKLTRCKTQAKARTYAEIIEDLSKDIPQRFLSERKQGGKTLNYISWHDAVKLFELYAPGWEKQVVKFEQYHDWIFMIVKVTIHASDCSVSREASGLEKLDKDSWGDPSSNAESMAVRRAFANFGLGLYLYHGDDSQNQNYNQNQNQNYNRSSQPPANQPQGNTGNSGTQPNGGSKTASEKQIKFLTDLCLKKDLSEIDICLQFSEDNVEVFDHLSVGQAKAAIDYLMKQK
jgi:hypothetical protein